jgi:hypothetical protein
MEGNFENIGDLMSLLKYGKPQARTAKDLYIDYTEVYMFDKGPSLSADAFYRKLRALANEARENGIRVIGDESGYYIAVSQTEWDAYKKRRFHAMKDELDSFSKCERLSVRDLIKEVFYIKVENQNFELF